MHDDIPLPMECIARQQHRQGLCQAKSVRLQMVAVYCQGMIPGLWPFIFILVIMKVMSTEVAATPTVLCLDGKP